MLLALIVAAEVAFWAILLAGLVHALLAWPPRTSWPEAARCDPSRRSCPARDDHGRPSPRRRGRAASCAGGHLYIAWASGRGGDRRAGRTPDLAEPPRYRFNAGGPALRTRPAPIEQGFLIARPRLCATLAAGGATAWPGPRGPRSTRRRAGRRRPRAERPRCSTSPRSGALVLAIDFLISFSYVALGPFRGCPNRAWRSREILTPGAGSWASFPRSRSSRPSARARTVGLDVAGPVNTRPPAWVCDAAARPG